MINFNLIYQHSTNDKLSTKIQNMLLTSVEETAGLRNACQVRGKHLQIQKQTPRSTTGLRFSLRKVLAGKNSYWSRKPFQCIWAHGWRQKFSHWGLTSSDEGAEIRLAG